MKEMDIKHNYYRDATIPQLFIEAAVTHPEKIALTGEEGAASYADLLNYAQNFAERLRARYFIAAGAKLGLAAGRSFSTVGAILGILMTGAAYVPFDIAGSPGSLLARQIQESEVELILMDERTSRESCSQWWGDRKVVDIPKFFETSRSLGRVASSEDATALSAAYIMFTSGSTGTPKGVIVSHRSVIRLVSAQAYINFGPQEVFLLHSPLSFDASTLELWAALLHGATLVIAPEQVLSIADYKTILARYGVTTLWMTAAVFHLAAAHDPEMFSTLKQLIAGGDVITPERVRQVQRVCPGLQIVNGYGPTEATTFAACYRIPVLLEDIAPLPIGSALANTELYVLDESRRLLANGEAGELAIGGDAVALGYIGQPQLTLEKFIPDPFRGCDATMYLTGDRVRKDEQGFFHFIGRKDREQKIAGRRVDLDEVEAALSAHPSVRQSAVLTVVSEEGEKRLYAAVTLHHGFPGESSLRDYLLERLPKPSIPTDMLEFEELPLSVNGKLDRRQIQKDVEDRLKRRREAVVNLPPAALAPRAAVLMVWKKLLNRDEIEDDTNFFDAGGSSLLLIDMHARLNNLYPGALELIDLFGATTPSKMGELLDRKLGGSLQSQTKVAV